MIATDVASVVAIVAATVDAAAVVAAAAAAIAADVAIFVVVVVASKRYRYHSQLAGSVRFDFRSVILVGININIIEYFIELDDY